MKFFKVLVCELCAVISVCMLFAVMCGDCEIFQSSAVSRLCDVVHKVSIFQKFPYVWTLYCGVETLNFMRGISPTKSLIKGLKNEIALKFELNTPRH